MCIEREEECIKCGLRHRCIYSYVFETPIVQKVQAGEQSKDEYVPHPFFIEPTLDEKQYYGINDRLDFHLILIGRAVDYIPYFIFAFEEMGRTGIGKNKGKYSLEKVISLKDHRDILIYDGKSHFKDNFQVIESGDLIQDAAKFNHREMTLRVLTPVRIKYEGKLPRDIDFEIVIRNLLRRLSRLAEVHCDEKWELDWKGLIEKAKEVKTVRSDLKWHDWERYSERQRTKLKMGGLLGEITFDGDLKEFIPFLVLGEYLHIGKGTVFGLGKYEIQGE